MKKSNKKASFLHLLTFVSLIFFTVSCSKSLDHKALDLSGALDNFKNQISMMGYQLEQDFINNGGMSESDADYIRGRSSEYATVRVTSGSSSNQDATGLDEGDENLQYVLPWMARGAVESLDDSDLAIANQSAHNDRKAIVKLITKQMLSEWAEQGEDLSDAQIKDLTKYIALEAGNGLNTLLSGGDITITSAQFGELVDSSLDGCFEGVVANSMLDDSGKAVAVEGAVQGQVAAVGATSATDTEKDSYIESIVTRGVGEVDDMSLASSSDDQAAMEGVIAGVISELDTVYSTTSGTVLESKTADVIEDAFTALNLETTAHPAADSAEVRAVIQSIMAGVTRGTANLNLTMEEMMHKVLVDMVAAFELISGGTALSNMVTDEATIKGLISDAMAAEITSTNFGSDLSSSEIAHLVSLVNGAKTNKLKAYLVIIPRAQGSDGSLDYISYEHNAASSIDVPFLSTSKYIAFDVLNSGEAALTGTMSTSGYMVTDYAGGSGIEIHTDDCVGNFIVSKASCEIVLRLWNKAPGDSNRLDVVGDDDSPSYIIDVDL
ncbi:MAG: hypothetical protein HN353_05680 [Bdellovibrionales bacterium]|nr:hypothetical protein [Bdellovibrionales bacterium]MBT3525067.1 hypothetical protein [Bdellovibrionales bacterium]MBT7767412.1 hypothetical protein [Bdellovibrionales bacterium]